MDNVRVIILENNKIIGTKEVKVGYKLQSNEMFSDIGEYGQIIQPDGTFIDDTTVIPQPYIPSNAEIAQMISDLQADLMIAGVI